jgi:uncharacterized protein
MSVRPDATLNLAKLLKLDPELGAEVSGEGEFQPSAEMLEADGLRLAGPLAWQLTVRASGGDDYILTGSVSGTTLQECRRCLTEVETTLRSSLIYPMLYLPKKGGAVLTLQENDDEDDTLVFTQPEVDFAPLLVQVFAIESPLTVLCKEDCKGLSLDGVNLNEHPEHAPARESDSSTPSPFESLKDIEL